MADAEKLREKLSLYLSTLSDSAQQLLLRSLEKGIEQGDSDAASELILAALKQVLRDKEAIEEPEFIKLEDTIKIEFFRPAKVFVADIDLKEKVEARLSPSSLESIWQWLVRDIANDAQRDLLGTNCAQMGDKEKARHAKDFASDILPKISAYIQDLLKDMAGEQKLSNQLGGSVVFSDLMELLKCGEQLSFLQPTFSKLPAQITSWSSPEGEEAYNAINKYVQQHPLKSAWIFSATASRIKEPKLRVELACRLAGSDDAVQVGATVYASAVSQLIAEIESYLEHFSKLIKQPQDIEEAITLLGVWRKAVRALEAELEVPVQSPWGKSISVMKSHLSKILEEEIGPAAGLIRKALRAPKEGAEEVADDILLQDATRAAQLFHHAERMKDSLALNEPIGRIRKELDQTFEILTTSLVDRTRNAIGDDIKTCNTLGEAAIIFARHLFDDNYASAFKRQLRAAAGNSELSATG